MASGAQGHSPELPPKGLGRASCPKAVKAEEAAVGRTTTSQRRSRQERGSDKSRDTGQVNSKETLGVSATPGTKGARNCLPRQEGGTGAGKQTLS